MHTPLAAKRFRQTIAKLKLPAERVTVVGLFDGKETDDIAEALVERGETVIVAPPNSERAADVVDVVRAFTEAGANVQRAANIEGAIDVASAIAGERGVVFVVGSLYTVAEAREQLLAVAGDRAFGLR